MTVYTQIIPYHSFFFLSTYYCVFTKRAETWPWPSARTLMVKFLRATLKPRQSPRVVVYIVYASGERIFSAWCYVYTQARWPRRGTGIIKLRTSSRTLGLIKIENVCFENFSTLQFNPFEKVINQDSALFTPSSVTRIPVTFARSCRFAALKNLRTKSRLRSNQTPLFPHHARCVDELFFVLCFHLSRTFSRVFSKVVNFTRRYVVVDRNREFCCCKFSHVPIGYRLI